MLLAKKSKQTYIAEINSLIISVDEMIDELSGLRLLLDASLPNDSIVKRGGIKKVDKVIEILKELKG